MGRPRSFDPLEFFIAPLGCFCSIHFWGFQCFCKSEGCLNGAIKELRGGLRDYLLEVYSGACAGAGRGLVLASNSLFPLQAADSRGARGREAAGKPHPTAAAAGGLPEEPGPAAARRPTVRAQLVALRPAEPAAVV